MSAVPAFPPFHRLASVIVFIAAAVWIGTGEFSAVGSAHSEEGSENPTPTVTPAAAPVLRTVAAIVPEFVDHSRKIRLSGTTAADKRVVLAARADGVVNTLALNKGSTIDAGTVVMTLEGPETLAQAKIAEIALAQKERELGVAERLYSGGNTPEIQLISARSERDAAAAQLTLANTAVDRLQLKAPFTGIVDKVEIELGEWVQTGAPVATILSLDPILVLAEISEVDVGSVATGAKAQITLVNGKTMEGTVRLVAREASAETRTYPVEISLPNPDNALPSGMTAAVVIEAGAVKAVVVPRSVITLAEDGTLGLRVVGADDVAAFAPVTIIDDTEAGMVVTGVPEGMRVVVAGQDLVRNGDKVTVVAAPGVTE